MYVGSSRIEDSDSLKGTLYTLISGFPRQILGLVIAKLIADYSFGHLISTEGIRQHWFGCSADCHLLKDARITRFSAAVTSSDDGQPDWVEVQRRPASKVVCSMKMDDLDKPNRIATLKRCCKVRCI